MGKTLDALLGRSFKASRFKSLLNLAISRLAILKNQRQVRCSHDRSIVVQLLDLGQHHQQALLRVEHVIKEQNMLDAFVKIEGYCRLLIERISLLQQERVCPDELKEAIASLIYAASRCGEFPELQEIRSAFASRFGKEFVARAVELRNNCGVNPQLIQKLSTRPPSLESRMKLLKEIAAENGTVLQLEEASPVITVENKEPNKPKEESSAYTSGSLSSEDLLEVLSVNAKDEHFSSSMKTRRYKDVADAAQVAFESAAYAAAAARAAVELSRSKPHDADDPDSAHLEWGKFPRSNEPITSAIESKDLGVVEKADAGLGFEKKIHPIGGYNPEQMEEKSYNKSQYKDFKESNKTSGMQRSLSASSLDSGEMFESDRMDSNFLTRTKWLGKEIAFDEIHEKSGAEASSSHEQIHLRFQAGPKLVRP